MGAVLPGITACAIGKPQGRKAQRPVDALCGEFDLTAQVAKIVWRVFRVIISYLPFQEGLSDHKTLERSTIGYNCKLRRYIR